MFAFLFLYACDENTTRITEADVSTRSVMDEKVTDTDTPFTFDSITNPMVWRTFQSLEEMQAACQIPENILESMPTDYLVKVCMNYPLFGNYTAYNNELNGINNVIKGFNGFAELQKREDAADKLITYYEGMDIGEIAKKAAAYSKIKNELSILHIGYLELILSSRFVPSLYTEPNMTRLEEVRYKKYEEKLQHPTIYSIETVKKSLLLGAQIKLESKTVNAEERAMLSLFVEMGGEVKALEDYTKLSQIINKE